MSKYDLHGDPMKVQLDSSVVSLLRIHFLQAGPQPKFKPQEQDWPGYEHKMDPAPDYGLDSYKGSGKLQDKIAVITGRDRL